VATGKATATICQQRSSNVFQALMSSTNLFLGSSIIEIAASYSFMASSRRPPALSTFRVTLVRLQYVARDRSGHEAHRRELRVIVGIPWIGLHSLGIPAIATHFIVSACATQLLHNALRYTCPSLLPSLVSAAPLHPLPPKALPSVLLPFHLLHPSSLSLLKNGMPTG
jgi:hypothetical protein